MTFDPEYVSQVLSENFEDAKTLFLSPLIAIHYAHLVMLRERDIISAADAHVLREALDSISLSRHPGRALRQHLRGSLLLRRSHPRECVRRIGGRPSPHRAQPQRHRHDDVPDAAAGVHRRADRRRAGAEGGAARPRRATATRCLPRTRTRSRRSRRRSRTTCWASSSSSSATSRGFAPRSRARTAVRSARARSPAPAFRSIAS